MKVFHVVGTRPNFMKVAPVLVKQAARPEVEQRLVHTGHHYDRRLSDAFFEDLSLPQPDFFLEVGSGSHGEQTAHGALGVPCFTLRANTERPITVAEGTNRLLEVGPPALAHLLESLEEPPAEATGQPEGWDGAAAGRVARVLVERYGQAGLDRERLMVSGVGDGAR